MLNQHDARRADDIYLTVEFITMPSCDVVAFSEV